MSRSRLRRWATGLFAVIIAVLISSAIAPEVLAFPYHRTIGDTEIYSERPPTAALPAVLERADTLLHKSAIYGPSYGRRIFLTDGGWRWVLLATRSHTAFAISRPFSEVIVINRSDAERDLVFNSPNPTDKRSLSGVIGHERAHGLIRARYGAFADVHYPVWLREGYCDYIAGGGRLSDAEVAALEARRRWVPALDYYDGRKRVEAALRANGGSVDALFAQAR